ncbi:MAG: SpoIIE family protein phosphatase [Succinivibrio sp.]|nr:SpoIIE family protein phosphatase [Succinivibrio sp.]
MLALSGSLLTFLIFLFVSVLTVIYLWNITSNHSREISKLASEYTGIFTRNAELQQLDLMVRSKAAQISLLTREIKGDVQFLSGEITHLLMNRKYYKPREIQTVATATSFKNVPLLRMNRDLIGSTEAYAKAQDEIAILGNLKETFESFSAFYDSVFFGSKNGYAILTYKYPEYHIEPEVLEHRKADVYDTLNRPWYKFGMTQNKLTFTELYKDNLGTHTAVSVVMPYYDEYGVAGVVGVDVNYAYFMQLKDTELRAKNGNYFIINSKGQIIFSTLGSGRLSNERRDSLLRDDDLQTIVTVTAMVRGRNGLKRYNLDGKDYYLAYAPIAEADWSIGMLIDPEEVFKPARKASLMVKELLATLDQFMLRTFEFDLVRALMLLPLLLILIYFIASRFAGNLSHPVVRLTKGVADLAKGDFNFHAEVKTGDEIELLARNFEKMSHAVNRQISELKAVTAEKERISTELNVATGIQLSMLPHDFPSDRESYDLYATSIPAKEVGGDFYDFYRLDQDHLAVTIADVSGKGVPAALFMVISKTILKNCTLSMGSVTNLAKAVDRANLQLYQDNQEEMFVTVFIGVLNLNTGEFDYVSAGHNPPLLGRVRDGRYQYLPAEDNRPMLGVLDDISYVQQQLHLEYGDTLFLYTDGVTEAMDLQGEQFGTERLQEVLNAGTQLALKQQSAEVLQAIHGYVGEAEQSDDITMLSLRYLGKQGSDLEFSATKQVEASVQA